MVIKAPPRQPKAVTVQARVEESAPTNRVKNRFKERLSQRPRNKHEDPSNPIRWARDYSVLATACHALGSRYRFERNLHRRRQLTTGLRDPAVESSA